MAYLVRLSLPKEIFADGTAKYYSASAPIDFIDGVRRQILLADALAYGLSGAQSSRELMISDSFITNTTRQDFEEVLRHFRGMRGKMKNWDVPSFIGLRCVKGDASGSWASIHARSAKTNGDDVTAVTI